MTRFILNRLYHSIFTLALVTIAVFLLGHLAGDPIALMVPPEARPEDREVLRHALGLDRPLLVQYALFMANALHGDFGDSLWHKQPAMTVILAQLPATVQLAAVAMGLAVAAAIPLGILAATHRNSVLDRLSMALAVLGQSIPNFWLGIMLIFLFSVALHWLPSSGRGSWNHVILPAITLAAFPMARLARLTRSGMLDVLAQDYIEVARAKGLRERTVIIVHALRNAAISLVTVLGLQFGVLVGGAVIIETIFAWPGIGLLVTQAIHVRDFPIVRAAVLLVAAALILINLVVDLLYGIIDPRIVYK